MKKEILFVDDDPLVLEGLERSLYYLHDRWSMTFLPSGRAALARLEEKEHDVLVTDMKMPEMDGAELIRRVREQHPSLVRVVLSGYSEFEATLRAIPVAHHYLLKPCEPQKIEDAVERGYALRRLLADDSIQHSLAKVGELPSAPSTYARLLAVLSDPETALSEAAEVIEEDPVLTGKVLSLANSAALRTRVRIDDVRHAATHLGANMLKNLVLSAECLGRFERDSSDLRVYEDIRRHCILVGALACRLAPRGIAAEDAYVAGVLHDIGRLLISIHLPEEYARIAVCADMEGIPVREAEAKILGTTHAEIGACILDAWGLSYPVIEAVAHHHTPERVPSKSIDAVLAVHIANGIARELDGMPLPDRTIDLVRGLGLEARLGELREAAVSTAGLDAA